MDFKTQLGLDPETAKYAHDEGSLIDYVNLKLTSIGEPTFGDASDSDVFGLGKSLLASYQEKSRLLADYLPPCDQRIQSFLMEYFSDLEVEEIPHLPKETLILDRHGIARTLSVPAKGDHFSSDVIDSYRIQQGVLHNPKSDRRTTKGVFHVAEGGLPIPNDKKAVPKLAAARLLKKAITGATGDLLALPFLANEAEKAKAWVSLLLRPVVVPEVDGFSKEKSMEVRFFVPGNLCSNLDFVESIFGNGGDPFIAENDAGLDPGHWTPICRSLSKTAWVISPLDCGLRRASSFSAMDFRISSRTTRVVSSAAGPYWARALAILGKTSSGCSRPRTNSSVRTFWSSWSFSSSSSLTILTMESPALSSGVDSVISASIMDKE